MAKYDPGVYVSLANEGISNREIARRLKVDESTVRHHLKLAGHARYLIPTDAGSFELEPPLEHHGNLMITADYHIPLYNVQHVNDMIESARRNGIHDLVIAGDFFNFDALSRFDPKQEEASLWREINEGIAVMRVLLETFDNIYYLWGNHDARLHKALGFKMQFAEAMRMLFGKLDDSVSDKLHFSNLDHMFVYTDSVWYICHPARYSQVPLATPRLLADKLKCNIITAHAHHFAAGYAKDGETRVAEAGGLFSAYKTEYLQRTTVFPNWQNGFAYLKDDILCMESPAYSIRL